MRAYLGLALAALVGLASSTQAEPLNPKQLSAGAKWLAHFDADAAHASVVVKNIREEFFKQHPGLEVMLVGIKEVWKFDPRTDLHSLTFYGDKLKADAGVALVRAKRDEAISSRLIEKAQRAPDYQATTYGKHQLHTWTHDKGASHERSITGAFFGSDTVVFGLSTDEVKAALDVLDGTKPSLGGSDSPLAATVPPGTILVVRAVGVSEVQLPREHPVVKQIDALSVAVGEYKGDSFVDAKLTLKNPELAQNAKSVIEGLRGIAMIVHGDDANAVKLLKPLKVSVAGKELSIEWRAPAETVSTQMQKMREKIKAHHERRGRLFPHRGAENE